MDAMPVKKQDDVLTAGIKAVVARLASEASRRVGLRSSIEERWLEDIRQYHGRYPDDVRKALAQAERSSVFINLTRSRTKRLRDRMVDMLFPADEENWDIQPTPSPEMAQAAEETSNRAFELSVKAAENPEAKPQADEVEQEAERINAVLDEARRRIDGMRREMRDQLVECQYAVHARDVIDDAVKIGVGIMRGPVAGAHVKRKWVQAKSVGGMTYVLKESADMAPAFWRADPWSVFFDPDARSIDDGEGVYCRHLMLPMQVRRLAKLDGFDKEALRRVLRTAPTKGLPGNLAALRDITGDTHNVGERYHVWEYEGPLSAEDVAAMAKHVGDEATAMEAGEADPLTEMHVVVWWCGDEVLRFDIHPLDSGECRYSVFCLEKDEASIYGYGLPSILRDAQSWFNSVVRMCVDNGASASGPQVLVDKDAIEPEDGNWRATPWKLWLRKMSRLGDARVPAFEFVQPSANLEQIIPMLDVALRFVDEITGMPVQMDGEPGAGPRQTATGTALVMSSANVTFRGYVRNFDDDMTVPNIRRLYHFNMQFSPKEHIKGDAKVAARGSSALMVRELQSQNLMAVAQMFGAEDPDIKSDEVKAEIFRSLNLDPERFMRTPKEKADFIAQMQQANAEVDLKSQELDLKEQEISAKVSIAQMEAQSRIQVAQLNYDRDMQKLAENLNVTREEMDLRRAAAREQQASKERVVATEAALKSATGDSSGGYV